MSKRQFGMVAGRKTWPNGNPDGNLRKTWPNGSSVWSLGEKHGPMAIRYGHWAKNWKCPQTALTIGFRFKVDKTPQKRERTTSGGEQAEFTNSHVTQN